MGALYACLAKQNFAHFFFSAFRTLLKMSLVGTYLAYIQTYMFVRTVYTYVHTYVYVGVWMYAYIYTSI